MTRLSPLLAGLLLLVASAARADIASSLDAEINGVRRPRFFRQDLPNPRPTNPPRRIVSLAPVVTETLFALDLGASVVGVTRFCDRPAEARSRPKVGGFVDPQLEAILTLKPDLVIAMPSFGQRTVLEQLRARGVPVLVVFGDSLDEVKGLIGAIADATGRAEAGAARVKALEQALEGVTASLPQYSNRPRTAVVFQVEPLVVAGPRTFPDEVLPIAGGSPAAPRNAPGWPTWSLEALLFLRPDVIVAAEGDESARRLEALVARATPKGRAPRVVSAGRPILMRPGPHLAEDVAALARLLHPGLAQPEAGAHSGKAGTTKSGTTKSGATKTGATKTGATKPRATRSEKQQPDEPNP